MKIFKYEINESPNPVVLKIPSGSVVLSIQVQHNKVFLWAKVNPDNSPMDFKLHVETTGSEIKPENSKYVTRERHMATLQMNDGYFVMHVFNANEIL